jgi:cellulose biosynthesis protein BcsQ
VTPRVHLDQARKDAVTVVRDALDELGLDRVVILDDLFGRIRIVVWSTTPSDKLLATLGPRLAQSCGSFWTGELHAAGLPDAEADAFFYTSVWNDATPVPGTDGRLRLNDRHRNRTAWFLPVEQTQSIWPIEAGVPIVAFYSFKGGVGRTTALASYAVARARRGERLAVVDCDLDAPGVGRLLDSDGEGSTAEWGVVDFLLEHAHDLPFADYRHACARAPVTGDGVIDVFPAGRVDDDYVTKLARVDLEIGTDPRSHPLATLLRRIRDELRPSVILVDCRAGLSPAAGLLLSGLAHLHVLFATASHQNFAGLERVVHRLGHAQARAMQPQADCLVVQAMLPEIADELPRAAFEAQVEAIFRDHYYAVEPDPEERLWSLRDLGSSVAPHVPVLLHYRAGLAWFARIDDVAQDLVEAADYRHLGARLDERLAQATPSSANA